MWDQSCGPNARNRVRAANRVLRAGASKFSGKTSNNLAQKGLASRRNRSVTDEAGAQRLRDLNPAGPHVWAGLRQCGGCRRFGPKEIPVSIVQRTSTPTTNPASPTTYAPIRFTPNDRRTFIGGSDPRIIMGDDESNLVRLWREKRGEAETEDLSCNL